MKHYRLVNQRPQPRKDTRALEAHRDSLYQRLELGYERIEEGLQKGEDVTPWEDYWTELLREYERICNRLQRDLAM